MDVTKEAEAQSIRMGNLTSTLEREAAEQGQDYEELLDQIEMEAKDLAARGLQHPAFAERPPVQSPSSEEIDAEEQLEAEGRAGGNPAPRMQPVGTTPMETPNDLPLPQ